MPFENPWLLSDCNSASYNLYAFVNNDWWTEHQILVIWWKTDGSAHRWRGSQQSQVIHLVCPVKVFPICAPVTGSHRNIYKKRKQRKVHGINLWKLTIDQVCESLNHTWLFLHPEASFFPSGDQAMLNTQCVCPKINSSGLKQSIICSSMISMISMLTCSSDFIPLDVWWGVSVVKSQKRTVVSPEPLARYLKQIHE